MTATGEQSLRWLSAEKVGRTHAGPGVAEPIAQEVAELIAEYSGTLYRVAYSVLRNAGEAEDAVQDTFLRVMERPEALAEVRAMRPWLVRIAWNIALDRRRRVRPEQMDAGFAEALVGRHVPADEALCEVEEMRAVLLAMDRLPMAERQVLLLSAVEELGTAELAEVLGKSESAVRALLFRARTRLRERLGKGGRR